MTDFESLNNAELFDIGMEVINDDLDSFLEFMIEEKDWYGIVDLIQALLNQINLKKDSVEETNHTFKKWIIWYAKNNDSIREEYDEKEQEFKYYKKLHPTDPDDARDEMLED